jgi:hypothetical protein
MPNDISEGAVLKVLLDIAYDPVQAEVRRETLADAHAVRF